MAKASFHRNQRVWVDTVGTWAVIEKVAPIWAQGFEEPVRITYDVGLGRPFLSHELSADDPQEPAGPGVDTEWRMLRARNKWQPPEDCAHHPYPGTFPVVVTDSNDWGGWRVPGAEYDRDPHRIERQARVLTAAPRLMQMLQELVSLAADDPESTPAGVLDVARRAERLLRLVAEKPTPAPRGAARVMDEPERDAA